MSIKAKHIKINGQEVHVKYAKEYSGKFLPSYEGLVVENSIDTESGMNDLYGKIACWDKIGSNVSYNTWLRKATIIDPESGAEIQVLPGMVIYNFSTPTKEIFCETTGLSLDDIEVLNASKESGESGYESGHLLWRNNFQFYYDNDIVPTARELKPYKGMLVQIIGSSRQLESGDGWKELDNNSLSGVYQYEYINSTTSTNKRPSYPGMIIADTCESGYLNYEGTWSEDMQEESGIHQYMRIK